jgi:hypothetical protein
VRDRNGGNPVEQAFSSAELGRQHHADREKVYIDAPSNACHSIEGTYQLNATRTRGPSTAQIASGQRGKRGNILHDGILVIRLRPVGCEKKYGL